METSVQFDVDNTSSTASYPPFHDTLSTSGLSAGWNSDYTFSGFVHVQGEVGNGTTFHIISLDGASLALQFHGTGIKLRGNVTFASYAIFIDSQMVLTPRSTSQSNDLVNVQNLKDGAHNVTLTAKIPQGQNAATLSIPLFERALVLSPGFLNVIFQVEQINGGSIAFLGRWTFETTPSGASFYTSRTAGTKAVMVFKSTTIIIQGTTSQNAGSYSVTLDNATTTLNGTSSSTVYEAILYFAAELNSNTEHTVVVENIDGGQLSLLSRGVSVFIPLDQLATILPHDGAVRFREDTEMLLPEDIGAFILAGILGFILLAGCLFYFLYYRPRRQQQRQIVNDRQQPGLKEYGVNVVLDIHSIPSGSRSVSVNASSPQVYYPEDSRSFPLLQGELGPDRNSQRIGLYPRHENYRHQSQTIPMMPLAQRRGGSLSTVGNPYITDPSSMHRVPRSLSPRTSETPQHHPKPNTIVSASLEQETLYTSASSRTRTTNYGHYARRMALSVETTSSTHLGTTVQNAEGASEGLH